MTIADLGAGEAVGLASLALGSKRQHRGGDVRADECACPRWPAMQFEWAPDLLPQRLPQLTSATGVRPSRGEQQAHCVLRAQARLDGSREDRGERSVAARNVTPR